MGLEAEGPATGSPGQESWRSARRIGLGRGRICMTLDIMEKSNC